MTEECLDFEKNKKQQKKTIGWSKRGFKIPTDWIFGTERKKRATKID